ncbi:DUF418 domain-containing protein [Ureibacillus thermophilus]|uniref:DUF418 domain-containing protein n=2 Tax=Ureibacillus thermophilus TaxID=367743 RepID=A0A4P6USF4_9BACL|nr:DUF418 domain-containing protein [Ureibacillus thermophilus]
MHEVSTYFKSIGRLSMTNYLFQSLICTTIFYGYGLALFGKLGVFTGIILAVVIFRCQAFISRLYLKKWKIGPFEKLMRIGTYLSWNGKVKPNTKKVENFDRNIGISSSCRENKLQIAFFLNPVHDDKPQSHFWIYQKFPCIFSL